MKPDDIRTILAEHDTYWDAQRPELRELKALYMTEFWRQRGQKGYGSLASTMRTEMPRAYAMVESYLGSLYAKNPAVLLEPDIRGRGNPQVAEATANRYLLTVRESLEDATRLALIFTCGFMKMAPRESVDPLKRVSAAACPPWEVIVDATAPSWNDQRWVGHVHLMPLSEAVSRYSKRKTSFSARTYSTWIDAERTEGQAAERKGASPEEAADAGQWVRVVEMYDLQGDALLVWSPDYAKGDKLLFSGVKVQVGALDPDAAADVDAAELDAEVEHVKTGIPYKSASGRPVVPIIPLYFSRDPEIPLRGYSLVGRSRDQFRELNVMRTYQAQGVRRMARQWLVREGLLSETAAAKLAQGIDGEFIEVDAPAGIDLAGEIVPVPNTPIPADISLYGQQVSADINDAGMLAPFTRGDATGTTATEQRLLAAYTSSEIGRMARIRDGVIAGIAQTYNVMLSVLLGDEAEPLSLPNPIGPTMLSADDLTGDFQYWAVDAGSTPMSDMAKQQALITNAPILMQLGVPAPQLLAEIVRAFDLPESFNMPAAPSPAATPDDASGARVAPAPGEVQPLPFPPSEVM